MPTLTEKIAQLDSLERIDIECEIDKRLEKKTEESGAAVLANDLHDWKNGHITSNALVASLDKRYGKKG